MIKEIIKEYFLSEKKDMPSEIKNWFLNYYQHGKKRLQWRPTYNKFLGLKDILVQDIPKYKLYRGIVIKKNGKVKPGVEYNDKRMSWTIDLEIAKKFATGEYSMIDTKDKLDKNEMGVILFVSVPTSQVLIDTNLLKNIDDEFEKHLEFPEEKEVVISPIPKKAKVYKVFYSK